MPSRHFSRRCCAAMTATAEWGHRMREGRRILVVEDDVLVATLLAEILESVGWQVVGAVADLDTALDAAASEDFDAAVLDVDLGGQTVYPVAKVLDARRVPFVFVTAYGREALSPLFCRRPHLGKPFAPRELIGTVARLIAPAAEAGAGEIPDSHRWDSSLKISFARDSPLEGAGFELSVPRARSRSL
jgi:DNA-binding response OmpR family regulator